MTKGSLDFGLLEVDVNPPDTEEQARQLALRLAQQVRDDPTLAPDIARTLLNLTEGDGTTGQFGNTVILGAGYVVAEAMERGLDLRPSADGDQERTVGAL